MPITLLALLSFLAFAGDVPHQLVRYHDIAQGRPATLEPGDTLAYETSSGNTLHVGDVLVAGTPTGHMASATASSYGTRVSAVGHDYFASILNGTEKATNGKALMGSEDWEIYAPPKLAGMELQISRMQLRGKKRTAIFVEATFVNAAQKTNGSGIVAIQDLEGALRLGELRDPNVITREVAIDKLKEAKELLDLGVYTQEQSDEVKAKYGPYVAP